MLKHQKIGISPLNKSPHRPCGFIEVVIIKLNFIVRNVTNLMVST